MKKLILIAFDAEQTFIMNELKFYHEHSDEVHCTLYTMRISDEARRSIQNIDIVMIENEQNFGIRQKVGVLPQLFVDILRAPFYYVKEQNIRYQWNRLASKKAIAKQIESNVKPSETVMAYWFEEEALCLSYLKKMRSDIRAASRAHAFDLYEEEQKGGRQPFRQFMLENIDTILPVSNHGVHYLRNKFPQYASKITLGSLGIPESDMPLNKAPENPVIVSCGAVSARKRTLEILEVVKRIPNATWVHFGAGDLFDTLKEKCKGLNEINVQLKGHVPVEAVMEYYKNNPVTAFISLSSSEGVPVSMMEAISCGIPVIATNAGGTADLVNESTGLLVDIHYDTDTLLNDIQEKIAHKFKDTTYREGVRAYWDSHYNATRNYKKFIDTIIQ
jgi:glycosyltransferase involved in cell wall biosynthesis